MKCREERYLPNGIVELDDTYFGAPTHLKKRGRGIAIKRKYDYPLNTPLQNTFINEEKLS